MTEKIERARQIRLGAERLRKIAASEANAERVVEMTRIAQDMDEHATELERSIVNGQSQNMAEYRLYFVDENGAIEAREEFHAPDDDLALAASNLVSRACSDASHSYELWQGSRQVIAFGATRENSPLGLTDEQTVAVQQITLSLEDALQRSHWRIARSEKLRIEMERLKERCRPLLTRRDGPRARQRAE